MQGAFGFDPACRLGSGKLPALGTSPPDEGPLLAGPHGLLPRRAESGRSPSLTCRPRGAGPGGRPSSSAAAAQGVRLH